MNAQATKFPTEEHQKMWDMIKDIRFCQMVTHDAGDRLSARPMSALKRDEEDALWFFTAVDSGKVQAIEENHGVLLAYSDTDANTWVSITGRASIVQDREKIAALWNEGARGWFPKGPDDPRLCLIKVAPEAAEYWDAPSSSFVIAWGYAKARLTGQQPELGDSGRVRLS